MFLKSEPVICLCYNLAMAIGVDIEDISRFVDKSEDFLKRIFTDSEIEYCSKFKNPESHYAARFCAKEAVIKALTPLNIHISEYNMIEIYKDRNDCPKVRILKDLPQIPKIELSISHDKTKAIAFVTAEFI